MNRNYYIFEDKAIVSDHEGNLTERDNQENLDDILVQENIVDALRAQMAVLTQEQDKQLENPGYVPKGLSLLLAALTVGLIPLVSYIITNGFPAIVDLILIIMKIAAVSGVFSIPFFISDHFKRKAHEKNLDYLSNAIENVRKKYTKESEKLDSLKYNMSKVIASDKTSGIKTVDNKEESKIRDEVYNSFILARHASEYYKYYRKGLLEKNFGTNNAEEYKRLIEENGPEDIKRLNLKK